MSVELNVKTRTILGKKVKSLRDEGFVPAELYGHKVENKHLSIAQKEFGKVYKTAGETTVINLLTDKGEKIPALIANVERHPIKNFFLNVDFHQVKMDEKMKIKVPVNFVGEAPATKSGLVLIKVASEIEIEALPNDIPHGFDVDLSSLEQAGSSIHIKDLKMPKNVKLVSDPEAVIATISEQMKEEVVEAPTVAPSEVPATSQKSPEEIAAEAQQETK